MNRYLPVYKLDFDRPDSMQVYVETSSDKLALTIQNRDKYSFGFLIRFTTGLLLMPLATIVFVLAL